MTIHPFCQRFSFPIDTNKQKFWHNNLLGLDNFVSIKLPLYKFVEILP